jgi:hypothetical protein
VDECRELHGIDEWREWMEIRRLTRDASLRAGPEVRRLVFSTIHRPVCSFGVWLFNVRKERAIANAVFVWLLEEARAVDHQPAIDLEERNAKCGPF